MFSIIGFLLLAIMTLILFALAFVENIAANGFSWLFFLQVILLIGLIYEMNQVRNSEISFNGKKPVESFLKITDLYSFIVVFAGTLSTFFLGTLLGLGLGAVVASGLVGVFATLIIPKYDVPAICGSYAGMASCSFFISYDQIVIAGIIAGLVFVICKNVFNGFGGKLGTIALLGCIFGSFFTASGYLPMGPIPGWATARYLLFYSVLAAVVTYILNVRLKHSPVISSGSIGILSGLIMPVIYPEIGGMIAIMMYCSSFAGMSSQKRIPNEIYIAIAGAICAFIYVYSFPYFGGTGGKLGTIAFASVIIVRGIIDIFDFVIVKKKFGLLAKEAYVLFFPKR